MVWDAVAIMRAAIGVFFLVFGTGLAYALFRLGAVFRRTASVLGDAGKEVGSIFTRMVTTLDEVNSQMGKADET